MKGQEQYRIRLSQATDQVSAWNPALARAVQWFKVITLIFPILFTVPSIMFFVSSGTALEPLILWFFYVLAALYALSGATWLTCWSALREKARRLLEEEELSGDSGDLSDPAEPNVELDAAQRESALSVAAGETPREDELRRTVTVDASGSPSG